MTESAQPQNNPGDTPPPTTFTNENTEQQNPNLDDPNRIVTESEMENNAAEKNNMVMPIMDGQALTNDKILEMNLNVKHMKKNLALLDENEHDLLQVERLNNIKNSEIKKIAKVIKTIDEMDFKNINTGHFGKFEELIVDENIENPKLFEQLEQNLKLLETVDDPDDLDKKNKERNRSQKRKKKAKRKKRRDPN